MILFWTSLPLVKQRCIDQILLTFLIRNIEMTIKAKTDRHGLPMWRLWSCRIIAFKLYFCSHKRVFMRFSLFVRDKQRSIFLAQIAPHRFSPVNGKTLWNKGYQRHLKYLGIAEIQQIWLLQLLFLEAP